MRTWVDGSLVDEQHARVSAYDHGLTVGDGVFETLKVVDGQAFALTRHLRRLARSAALLGLPAPDLDGLRLAVAEALAANAPTSRARLRITYTGGVSPLGSERGGPPTLVVALGPLPTWAPTVDVVTVPWTRNERSPVAGVKTTSYAENVVAFALARERGAGEAILANTLGDLCEGTGSNVFLAVRDDRVLVTPPLSTGCLAGVTRELVLEWLGPDQVVERRVPLTALGEATEAFLTSSTRDVLPIRSVDGTPLPTAPGPRTSRAIEAFAARAAADPDP